MQRYFSKEKIDNCFILNDDDIYHIRTVMRMKDNDNIIVVYDKKAYLCCIENVKENIQIRAEKELEKVDYKTPNITLIIPLLKEQKMDLILQKSTVPASFLSNSSILGKIFNASSKFVSFIIKLLIKSPYIYIIIYFINFY